MLPALLPRFGAPGYRYYNSAISMSTDGRDELIRGALPSRGRGTRPTAVGTRDPYFTAF